MIVENCRSSSSSEWREELQTTSVFLVSVVNCYDLEFAGQFKCRTLIV